MAIMNEALSKEDYEKWDKGKSVPKAKPTPRPEPTPPKVDNLIKFESVVDGFEKVLSYNLKIVKNADGMNFVGYDVTVLVKGKRPPGRPKEGEPEEPPSKVLVGWMFDGDFLKLRAMR